MLYVQKCNRITYNYINYGHWYQVKTKASANPF